MQIIPVLDLMNGQVVRGVAGKRDRYAPVQSRLTSSCDPVSVVSAIRDTFGLNQLYVADLDGIVRNQTDFESLGRLVQCGFRIMADVGVREESTARQLLDMGIDSVIIGLETLDRLDRLARLVETFTSDRVVFSLDLKDGKLLGRDSLIATRSPLDLVSATISLGVRRLIVLDLARVGVENGIGTESLCRRILSEFHDIDVMTGGGIRSRADLLTLQQVGVKGALVASALHNGSLARDDIEAACRVDPCHRPGDRSSNTSG